MLRVYAAHFIKVSNLLADLRGIIKALNHSGNKAAKFAPEILNDYLTKMDWLCNRLLEMQLNMSLITAVKIIKYIEQHQRPDTNLANYISELNDRVFDELNTRLVFIISSKEEEFYNPEGTIFGVEVANKLNKLPKWIDDIVEAGNCFAVGRYTACVFHLMRVMESAVQKFGKKLKINLIPEKESWYKISQHINNAIKVLPEKTLKETNKKDKYAAILIHLDNVRRVWRNDVMHPTETYTSEQAEDILRAVKIFIKDLVKIL